MFKLYLRLQVVLANRLIVSTSSVVSSTFIWYRRASTCAELRLVICIFDLREEKGKRGIKYAHFASFIDPTTLVQWPLNNHRRFGRGTIPVLHSSLTSLFLILQFYLLVNPQSDFKSSRLKLV